MRRAPLLRRLHPPTSSGWRYTCVAFNHGHKIRGGVQEDSRGKEAEMRGGIFEHCVGGGGGGGPGDRGDVWEGRRLCTRGEFGGDERSWQTAGRARGGGEQRPGYHHPHPPAVLHRPKPLGRVGSPPPPPPALAWVRFRESAPSPPARGRRHHRRQPASRSSPGRPCGAGEAAPLPRFCVCVCGGGGGCCWGGDCRVAGRRRGRRNRTRANSKEATAPRVPHAQTFNPPSQPTSAHSRGGRGWTCGGGRRPSSSGPGRNWWASRSST
jgi:hypothetical protein